MFNYIEMCCDPKRRHDGSNELSPVNRQKQYFQRREILRFWGGYAHDLSANLPAGVFPLPIAE